MNSQGKESEFVLPNNNLKKKPFIVKTAFEEDNMILGFSLIDRQIKLFKITLDRKGLI